MQAELDHIAISATTLAEGVSQVEDALGVALGPGGRHPVMGTHNRLLGMGPTYLEIIAIDPDAPGPDHPRWFDLDRFTGTPRLTNWIVRTDDLVASLDALDVDAGAPLAVTRGDLRWLMAVPQDGRLPFDAAFPALIEWQGPHPTDRLEDSGCRLRALEVIHPEAEALRAALAPLGLPVAVTVSQGPRAFRAEIGTPHGRREITG
ncbi:VOC family protein [Anianabacter salinae]|uniref:VOC family protein n=1 Tax=Anianabacter salinae TaxID=2851023 RepID=UPI00225E1C71|nr:VOC family protein [Anianabacter salinae]MBV0913923.1 VOC family protein [Anianabacter salinae]